MRVLIILLVSLMATSVWAICGLPPPVDQPPPGQPPEMPPPPPPEEPEEPETPETPPEDAPPPIEPPTPREEPRETPAETPRETPPPAAPPTPPTPPPAPPPETPAETPSSGPRRGPRSSAKPSLEPSWRVWWELNREHYYGLRQTIRSKDVVSSGERDDREIVATRARVREALRKTATTATHPGIRAAALRALGRAGSGKDADLFIGLLRKRQQKDIVQESAAIGLGLLPSIPEPEARAKVRELFDDLLRDKLPLGSRSRRVAILAISLRGRDDPMLAMRLGEQCAKLKGSERDAATLLYACGITRDPRLQATLIQGVTGDKIGGRKLSDVARGRAALGLALSGDPAAARTLAKVLRSRRAGVHTRRSAAVALGMVMRNHDSPEGAKALRKAFAYDKDPLVRGYVAVAMGTAKTPIDVKALRKAIDDRDRIVRQYAALAVGLACDRSDQGDNIRRSLFQELKQSKQIEHTAALSIAVGITRDKDARDHLFKCLKRKRLQEDVRAPAIQALGLLRQPSKEIEETLLEALDDKSHTVVEDASLALGFLGGRTTARKLVAKMIETKSASVQIHMVAALSHLGTTTAVEPLLEVLENSRYKHTLRESAAAALGILVDERKVDPLFEIDAHTNPFGLTTAARALVAIY